MQGGARGSLHTYIAILHAYTAACECSCVKASLHTSVISTDAIECTSCVGAGTGTCFVGYTVPLLTQFSSTILSSTDTGYCFMTDNCCFCLSLFLSDTGVLQTGADGH